jgi:hypothetical protein
MLTIRTTDLIKATGLLIALFFVSDLCAVRVKAQGAHEFCDPSQVGATWTVSLAGKAKVRDVITGLKSQLNIPNIVPDYDVMDIDLEAISVTASWKSILQLIMQQNGLAPVCMEGGILRIAKRDRLIASDQEQKQLLTSVVSQPRKLILVKVFVYSINEKVLNYLPANFHPLVGTARISSASFQTLIEQARVDKVVRIFAHPFASVLEQQSVEFKSGATNGFRLIRIKPQLSNDQQGSATNLTLDVLMETDQSIRTIVNTPDRQVVVLGGGAQSSSGGLFKRQTTSTLFYAISSELLP